MGRMIRCKNCRKLVPGNPRIKNQGYCNAKKCQNARKARWQRENVASDSDYRQGQDESNAQWLKNNPDYWQNYREDHPKYTKRNRMLQKERDRKRHLKNLEMDASDKPASKMDAFSLIESIISTICELSNVDLAKMDAFDGKTQINPGVYIVLSEKSDLAKMDASEHKYLIIPMVSMDLAKMDSMDFRKNVRYGLEKSGFSYPNIQDKGG